MNLLNIFRQTIQSKDLHEASLAILRMRKLKYPSSIILAAEKELLTASNQLLNEQFIHESLPLKDIPYISPGNYLLHRPDLQAAGFTIEQAKQHLHKHGLEELAQEAKDDKPRIRRYLDLNDTPDSHFWLVVCHQGATGKNFTGETYRYSEGVQTVRLDISTLCISLANQPQHLTLQEFAAWARIRKDVQHFCFVDQADLIDRGWQHVYAEALQRNPDDFFFCEEYIDFRPERPTEFTKRVRQYKSTPTRFRVHTRGYLSGIVAVPTSFLSKASLEDSYAHTWCLQVDLAQQFSSRIQVVHRPLLLRHQRSNPSIPEYSNMEGRLLFAPARQEFLRISKKNIEDSCYYSKNNALDLIQGESGEIIPNANDAEPAYISIIIPFRDQPELLKACINSLITNERRCKFEFLLADNGSSKPETSALVKELLSNNAIIAKHIRIDEEFNYSRINNIAARHATGDYIFLLNNDIEFRSPNPLSSMVAYFSFKDIGAVGTRLLFDDGSIQHQGIVLTPFEPYDTYCPFKSTLVAQYDYSLASLVSTDQWSAATAACLLIDRTTWEALGGLDESLVVAYNDVDFCLRALELGKDILVDSSPHIIHFESKSRGLDLKGTKYNRLYKEAGLLRSKHTHLFSHKDKFWPSLLSISNPRATPHYLDSPDLLSSDSPLAITKRIPGDQEYANSSPLNLCIYVNYSACDRLRPDVIWQLKEISRHYRIIFVTTSGPSLATDPLFESLKEHTLEIIFRENIGYDFGSWKAGILANYNLIYNSESLLLMNDSLYGPITSTEQLFNQVLNSSTDVTCMTLNHVGGTHAQSYFVSYNQSVFKSADFSSFWKTIPIYCDKFQLIKNCEMRWSHHLLNTGKTISALYDTGSFGNQTHIDWRLLIEKHDCPFIKNELILKNPVGQNIANIENIIACNSELHNAMRAYWKETDEVLAFMPSI